MVNKWFVDRQGKAGKTELDTRTVFIGDVPVIYGWPEGHKHAFFDTRYYDQLLKHMKSCMFPDAEINELTVSSPTKLATHPQAARPLAPCFNMMDRSKRINIAPELQPISTSQQQQDIQRLSTFFGVPLDDWPARPSEVYATAKHNTAFLNRWSCIPDAKRIRISEWISHLGVKMDPEPFVLAIAMRNLDGWKWPMGGGYPKEAVYCIRRAVAATHGLTTTHPLHRHIVDANKK